MKKTKKAKGLNRRHKEYVHVLFCLRDKRIQSKLHKIGTYDVCRISLSCFDDNRYILDDGINSLSYFHKDILKNKSD